MQRLCLQPRALPGGRCTAAAARLSSLGSVPALGACRRLPQALSLPAVQRRWCSGGGAVRASAGSGRPPLPSSMSSGSIDSDADDRPKPGLFNNIVKPLRDFGIGRTSMTQGAVGLFVFSGIGARVAGARHGAAWPRGQERRRRGEARRRRQQLPPALRRPPPAAAHPAPCSLLSPAPTPGFALMLIAWARGGQLGRRGQGYQAVLEFPVACGITVGTPVRIRGVPVGGVLSVQPSLDKVG